MAAGDLDNVNGIAKKVYDKAGIQDLRPKSAILQRRIGWDKGTRQIGESYQISVALRPPNGFTYPGSTGAGTAMKAARPMIIKQASITPFEMDLREQISYTALSRAAKEGEGAFAQLSGELFKGMKMAAANRLEAGILLGQRALGEVEAVTDTSGGTADLTITAATWRPGLWWAVGEGTTLDAFTSTTKNNASGPLVVSGITTASRKIRVTYTGTLANEVAAGDVLYFEGAWDGTTYNEMPGLLAQSGNTSGTSLGLSAATYMNWKGNTYDVAGPISSDVVEDAVSQLRDRGAAGRLSMHLANKNYSVVLNELKQLRVIDSSYSPDKTKVGTKSILLESPDVGEIELVNHPFMAWGEFGLFSEDDCGRVGSSDLTFGVPGFEKEQLFRLVDGYNLAEIQLFTDQCVVNKRPNHSMLGTGITVPTTP